MQFDSVVERFIFYTLLFSTIILILLIFGSKYTKFTLNIIFHKANLQIFMALKLINIRNFFELVDFVVMELL